MEHITASHRPDQLEEKDITLVLEQLQENGFSSFFDHPDCPFSSIQEVDEALKELEKEFLKISLEHEAKAAAKKKSKISMSSNASSLNHPKLKPKVKKNDLKNEVKQKLNTREKIDKKEYTGKKPENCKFGFPSTSRSTSSCTSANEMGRIVNPAECGDSKDVYGIDSCGNKYSLKIEVFATVKLEPEEDLEATKKMIKDTKIVPSPSKPKGLKRNDNLASFKPVVKPTKEQTENCAPLLLNYRSSMCKPCPSHIYPTACDLRKNLIPQKRKIEGISRNVHSEAEKLIEKNSCKDNFGKVIPNDAIFNRTDKIDSCQSLSEINFGINETKSLHAELDQNGKKEMDSVSTVKNNELMKDAYVRNHSIDIQTSLENNTVLVDTESNPFHIEFNSRETPEMFDQEQQTSQHEKLSSFKIEETTKRVATPTDNANNKMIDKEVETSLFLLFDQTLINELKGLEEMIVNTINNEDIDDLNIRCENNGCDIESNISNRFDESINEFIQEIASDDPNTNFYTDTDDLDELSEKIDSNLKMDDGVKSEKSKYSTYANNEREKSEVVYLQTVSEVEDGSAASGFAKLYENSFYDNELSDSSSNETVIMNESCVDLGIADELSTVREESTLDAETLSNYNNSDSMTYVTGSNIIIEEHFTDITLTNPVPFNSVNKEVGTYVEKVDFENVQEPTLEECINTDKLTEKKKSKYDGDVISSVKQISFVDKGVGMSEESFLLCKKQIMVDKEVRGTSIESFAFKSNLIMVDKEIGPENADELFKDIEMIDKEIGTIIESKSMSTNMDEILRKVSVKEMAVGASKNLVYSKNKSDEVTSEKENSSEIDSKSSDSKFAKWSKAKLPMGQKLFRKPDSKSCESDKFMRILKERREKRKSEEGSVKSKESSFRKDSRKHEEERDNTSCSNTSTSSSAHSNRPERENYRFKELSEYETKFVKGVFARHSSAAKNKIPFRRRAYSNLDQKISANKLAKSRKMIGSLKSSKKPSWDRSKSHCGGKPTKKQPLKELSSSSAEYKLHENTVIDAVEQ